jgi:hypothetical protein
LIIQDDEVNVIDILPGPTIKDNEVDDTLTEDDDVVTVEPPLEGRLV